MPSKPKNKPTYDGSGPVYGFGGQKERDYIGTPLDELKPGLARQRDSVYKDASQSDPPIYPPYAHDPITKPLPFFFSQNPITRTSVEEEDGVKKMARAIQSYRRI